MRFIRAKKYLAMALLTAVSVASCSTKSEDDTGLEAQEPVEAEPVKEGGVTQETSGTDSAVAPEAKPAESIATPTAPAAGTAMPAAESVSRRVMYVKSKSAVMREQPDSKSKVVGKLTKGDHMLVTIEGEWAKTDDGKYISMKTLSEKGVGRAKRDASWTGGQPSDAASAAPVNEPAPKKKKPATKLPAKTAAEIKAANNKIDAAKAADEAKPAESAPADGAPVEGQ